MTKKLPVSTVQNHWYDAEPVSSTAMQVEQAYNSNVDTSIINNQFGSGAIIAALTPHIIFDSAITTGSLDGQGISPQAQPSDSTYGNQLAITLSGSLAASNRTVKVAIIGLDFNENLISDTLTFHLNETQYTEQHYTNVLTILFNDFIGPAALSLNLGGDIVIQEAASFTVSRSPIMVSQDKQPNLFWRDFFTISTFSSLQTMLQAALPLYNVDDLNITTDIQQNIPIFQGDVSTQVGEKFLATTNNIQKATLLLSVQNSAPGQSTNLIWQGDLVISIYPLQSTVDCITDIVPNLAIDFTPSNVPLAQTSVNYSSLQAQGIVLDGNPQPVDFVFSNTQIANGSIIPNSYYILTLKRSGSASACDILIAAGGNLTANSQLSTFTGTAWVDNPDVNLWFRIWTDAVKVSDGQAYETGHGIILPKTTIDTTTNTIINNSLNDIFFTGTNEYTAVLSAQTQQLNPVPDQRTGNPVNSQQQFIPSIQLFNSIDFGTLETVSEPLTIGIVIDKNIKAIASSPTILAALHTWSFVGNTILIKIIDDITDGYRYDPNVIALVSDLLNGLFTDAKIVPNISNPTTYYRISSASLCSYIYGDVDGDGIITTNDLNLCNDLVGAELNISPPVNSIITTNGITTTVVNGYSCLTQGFADDFGLTWQIVNPNTNAVIANASDGEIVVNPNNPALASFESISTNFASIPNIATYDLVIFDPTNPQDQGSFSILTVDDVSNNVIDISKIIYTPDVIGQIMRADIDGNFQITAQDGYYIESYLNRASFPPSTSPYNKIGTPFSVITLTVEDFIDRADDLVETAGNRSDVLHPLPDIYTNDGYFHFHSFRLNPVSFNIVQQFAWEDFLITANGNARPVSTVITNETGLVKTSCDLQGITCEAYSDLPVFDPGTIDLFIPNNIILGGQITTPDGYYWKNDLEICPVVLQIPNSSLGTEQALNLFSYFVYDFTGTGITYAGYPAMKFADCTRVQQNALLNNQVRFSIALESFSPNVNGISVPDGYLGVVVSDTAGISFDPITTILSLNFANLYQDPVLSSLSTKVFITVYLKKAGFTNTPLFINSDQMVNLLSLIPSS